MTGSRPLLLLVVVSLLSACSGAGNGSTSATRTSPPTSSSSEGQAVAPTASEGAAASPSAAASPAEPDAAALPAGHVLVASDRGVDLLAPDGTSEALTSLPARAAYDDGAGGVVLQGLEPPGPNPPSAAVMWLPPDGSDAVTVVADGAADAVHLWDAGVVDGVPAGLLAVREGDTAPTLRWVTLPDGESTVVEGVAAPRDGVDEDAAPDLATSGGDRVAAHWDTADGSAVVVPGPSGTHAMTCHPNDECPSATAIADDGERLVSVQPAGDGHELVVTRLGADEPERVLALPAEVLGDAVPDDVRVAGDVAVVNRVAGTGDDAELLEALRIDLSAGEVESLPLAGRAAPTRA